MKEQGSSTAVEQWTPTPRRAALAIECYQLINN